VIYENVETMPPLTLEMYIAWIGSSLDDIERRFGARYRAVEIGVENFTRDPALSCDFLHPAISRGVQESSVDGAPIPRFRRGDLLEICRRLYTRDDAIAVLTPPPRSTATLPGTRATWRRAMIGAGHTEWRPKAMTNLARAAEITTTDDPLAAVPLGRYRLRLARCDAKSLPTYAGSALRGAFGHALRRLACRTDLPDCPPCPAYHDCRYAYVFETPPPRDTTRLRRYPAAPHPFILGPLSPAPVDMAAEGARLLDMTLIGRANALLPDIMTALVAALDQGLGVERGRLQPTGLEHEREPGSGRWTRLDEPLGPAAPVVVGSVSEPPSRVVLHTETPLRLVREGRVVAPGAFTFAALFGALLRRIASLAYFHADRELAVDFRALTAAAKRVAVDTDLRWRDLERYSSRQRASMKMGGLVGTVTMAGAGIRPFWPYLWLGQWINVGKLTSMGLGRYRLSPAADAAGS